MHDRIKLKLGTLEGRIKTNLRTNSGPYTGFWKGGFYFQFLHWGGRRSQMRGSGGTAPSRWRRCYNWYPVNGLKMYLWYTISIMKIDMPLYLKVLYSTTWQLIYIYTHCKTFISITCSEDCHLVYLACTLMYSYSYSLEKSNNATYHYLLSLWYPQKHTINVRCAH